MEKVCFSRHNTDIVKAMHIFLNMIHNFHKPHFPMLYIAIGSQKIYTFKKLTIKGVAHVSKMYFLFQQILLKMKTRVDHYEH